MGLNYGLDKVRFLSPVPVDSEIRMHSKVVDITEKNPGQFLVKSEVTMEIKGTDKPACIAETLSMWVTQLSNLSFKILFADAGLAFP